MKDSETGRGHHFACRRHHADIVEVAVELAGYPVILADTAGLRDSNDWSNRRAARAARQRSRDQAVRV
jgi:tRNA modification GTPase